MPPTVNNFSPLPASARIKAALLEMQTEYLRSIDKTENQFAKILALSASRQADLIVQNLTAFERRGTHIFATSQNLGLLEDLTNALAEINVPARDSARQVWVDEALHLRQVLTSTAPELGIDLARTDFARVSLATVHAAEQNAFSELSDFAQLQRGVVIGLKTEVGDSMARGLDYRTIGAQVQGTGITALDAIPGFRRAFSLQERGLMIARTETVRVHTQLQTAKGDEAGLDWGRSFLNWQLQTHDDLCLWAEAMGWAPVVDFQAGPGFPPRHTNCGCSWQQGLKDWVDPAEGPAAMAKDFRARVLENEVKLSADLFQRLPPHVQALVEPLVKAGRPKATPAAGSAKELPPAAPAAPEPPAPKEPIRPREIDVDALTKVDLHTAEPTWTDTGSGPRAYGGVLFDQEGRVLLREPTGHFDGYAWSFAKGKAKSGDHPADAALREVREETGHDGAIVGLVPGGFSSGSASKAFYFLMLSKGHDPTAMDTETQGTKWVTPEEAKALIGQSTNAGGKARDLEVLAAAGKAWAELQQGQQVASLEKLPTLTKAEAAQKLEAKKVAQEAAAKAAAKAAAEAAAVAAAAQAAALVQATADAKKQKKNAQAKARRAQKKAAAEAQKRLPLLQAKDVPPEQDITPLPAAEGFPKDPRALDVVRKLGGSTGAELVRDAATGKLYVRKVGASAEHLREEAATDAAYQALGVRVPAFQLYETPTGPVKLAEFIEGQSLASVIDDPQRGPKVLEQMQRHFAADALLGNWDVAGLSLDNILVDQAGVPVRIDNGGGLRFRGMGSAKTEAEWNAHPEELWTMRDAALNPRAARVFAGLDFFDLAAQMRDLQRFRDRLTRALPVDLRPTVLGRLESMRRAGHIAGQLETDAWRPEYVDQFTRHTVGLQKAGIVDALPEKLSTKLQQTRESRFGFNEYDPRTVKDETGKNWDKLRGAAGIMDKLETYVKKAGGDWKILSNYFGGQASSSWSTPSQGLKYFLATKARGLDPAAAFFWRYGLDKARTAYNEVSQRPGEAKYMASVAAAHAFTFEMLNKTSFANKTPDGQAAILLRTENKSVVDIYGVRKGAVDATMLRGALESASIFERTSIYGDETTLQRVPLWRIFWTYFTSRYAGSSHVDSFAGDGENEFMFMPEGLPFDYETWR